MTSVSVSVVCTPAAVPVIVPKLGRMSLRTMPVSACALTTLPSTVFEPSAGNGPSVSSAVTAQEPVVVVVVVVVVPVVVVVVLVSSPPEPPQPHVASSVAAARPAPPSSTRRRPRVSRSWARPLS